MSSNRDERCTPARDDGGERRRGKGSQVLVVVASADAACWHRAKEALDERFVVAFAVDLEGVIELVERENPAAVLIWSKLLNATIDRAIEPLRRAAPDVPLVAIETPNARKKDGALAAARQIDAYVDERVVGVTLRPVVESLVQRRARRTRERAEADDAEVAPVTPIPRAARPPLAEARRAIATLPAYRPLVMGNSAAFRRVVDVVGRAARTNVTVLISGESGTGKEVLARWIHCMSPRARRPFVAVDLPATPDELFESTLYGYERGAFTGALAPSEGKFEAADGGTLFLDEISSLKLQLQPKLLRTLQEKAIQRVGSNSPTPCDVRLIAATNVNLGEAVRAGEFRADLFYRLSVLTIQLPPLRERPDDLEELVQFFVDKYARQFGCEVPTVSEGTLDALKSYRWPGNIRELENRVQTALLMGSRELRAEDFFHDGVEADGSAVHFGDCEYTLEELQRLYIKWVLRRTDGNQSQAAQILRIDRKTLRSKLQRDACAMVG